MKVNDKVRKYWRNYYKPTYRIVVFVLATVLMALSFPGIGRFSYEYELSRPWRYEDVIAPYDFPIRKFDAEIAAEKDSLWCHTTLWTPWIKWTYVWLCTRQC